MLIFIIQTHLLLCIIAFAMLYIHTGFGNNLSPIKWAKYINKDQFCLSVFGCCILPLGMIILIITDCINKIKNR